MKLPEDLLWQICTHLGVFLGGAMSMFLIKINKYIGFMKEFAEMQNLVTKVTPILNYVSLSDERHANTNRRIEELEGFKNSASVEIASLKIRLDARTPGRRVSIAPTHDS